MKTNILQNLSSFTRRTIASAALTLLSAVSSNAFTTVTVQDSISVNTHWTCDNQYLLKGYVYVIDGATLTIDPGTIIKGDKNTKGSLIIERGAKLIAAGTLENPIVFTSNQPVGQRTYGDWGGVILCGKAPVNWNGGTSQVEGGPRSLYGGTNASDNSGTLQYVRIEFPGIAFSPNNEINGLTLCGVGNGTTLDHIQISYSGDDSYEFFGGTVNAKNVVAFRGWDDDFDTDNGYNGHIQFVVGIRDPNSADQSGSKAFESDSYQTGTADGLSDGSNLTKPVFSNCTMIGPLVNPTSTSYDPQFVAAAHIRRGSAMSLMNSILVGYPCGILIDESSSAFGSTARNLQINATSFDSILQIRNTLIAGIPTTNTPTMKEIEYVINGARNITPTSTEGDTITGNPFFPASGPFGFFMTSSYGNKIYPTQQNGIRLQNPNNLANPNLVPTSTSPVIYNSAHAFNPMNPINYDTTSSYAHYNVPAAPPSFSSSRLSDPFFTVVNYVGAFSGTGTTTDNWMNGWCNFDPVNTDYSQACPTGTGMNKVQGNVVSVLTYPNPFKGKTSVEVTLAEASNLSVAVYDITGRLVDQIVNENLNPGHYSFSVNIAEQPAGVYFARINAGAIQKTVKLMIVK